MKERIVIINQDSGYLMIDIANAFVNAGISASLISGRILVRNTPLSKNVLHEKIIEYNRKNIFSRLITWIIAFFQIIYKVKLHYKKSHLFIVTNPPLAPIVALLTRNKYTLLIYDIYPNAIINNGFLSEKHLIVTIWKKINTSVFKKAQNIFTLTDGMKELLKEYIAERKIIVIPIWSNSNDLEYVPKDKNSFIIENSLQNKFLIMYSGNVGKGAYLFELIEIASKIIDKDILFIVIGDGSEKEKLKKQIKIKNISNCLLYPFQSAENLKYSLSAADLSVVSLNKNVSQIGIPSKFYNFLTVGSPILGLAAKKSDLCKIINQYSVGKCFESENTFEILKFIITLKNNPNKLTQLRKNSFSAALNFTNSNAIKIVDKTITKL